MHTPSDRTEYGTPDTPREQLILQLFFLFLDACNELASAPEHGVPPTEDARLALVAALGLETTLAEAQAFLQADHWHRESARMDVLALRLLFRDHNRLQAAIDYANARRGGGRRAVA